MKYRYPSTYDFYSNNMDSVEFEGLIKSVLNNRKEQRLEKINLILEIDPKITKIFENSKYVSDMDYYFEQSNSGERKI